VLIEFLISHLVQLCLCLRRLFPNEIEIIWKTDGIIIKCTISLIDVDKGPTIFGTGRVLRLNSSAVNYVMISQVSSPVAKIGTIQSIQDLVFNRSYLAIPIFVLWTFSVDVISCHSVIALL
jgi:hypothetical protein